MNDLSKKIVNDAVELAKVNVINVLKGLKFDDIKSLVEAEMASIIKPLEDEIKTSNSYWVKIRNRIYITVLNNSVNSIVNSIQKKINEMQLNKDSLATYWRGFSFYIRYDIMNLI